jgi:DNA polymerase V
MEKTGSAEQREPEQRYERAASACALQALQHFRIAARAEWRQVSFWAVEARRSVTVPLMAHAAVCGFPSPADDYLDRPLDFNELIIENAAATFAVRVEGESMTGAGIFPGDIAVVNRAREPVDGCIVVALLDGEFTIKRYRKRGPRLWLEAANPVFSDIEISDGTVFEVWGVVSRCVRLL